MAAGKIQVAPKTETARAKVASPPAGGATPEQVAERAYQIWQESGCPHGRDWEHWLQAERELKGARPASRPALR